MTKSKCPMREDTTGHWAFGLGHWALIRGYTWGMDGTVHETHDAGQAAEAVRTLASGLGFALCGVAPAERSAYAEHFERWLAEGKHGEMSYLADHAALRVDPRELVEGARGVIVVADAYGVVEGPWGRGAEGPSEGSQDDTNAQHSAPWPPDPSAPSGRIAKYAHGDDYHKTIKKRLHAMADALTQAYPGHTFRATVDTAPIFERELATKAGLGWTGKHTLMIHPRHGSYFLLGTLVTTMEIATSETLGYPAPLSPPTDHCGSCTRCIDACPTDAIAAEGYSVDGSKCISYLTIEHRSAIDPRLFAGMGDWVAGCDVCQDVCPHNRRRLTGAGADANDASPLPIHPRYEPSGHGPTLSLLDILHWTEDDRRRVLRGSALKRIKLDMWHRNALIASGNALRERDDFALRERIEAMAGDEALPGMVRCTAGEVLEQLG